MAGSPAGVFAPSASAPGTAVASPCVKLCRIGADDRCEGCHRTIDEITRWGSESDAWRAAIMTELSSRQP
ncbi:MAG: DUF1289 domain-containing protein [Sphingomonas sp.]|nr:DUF1289 domain-containing protein [Sphingomonas sp.]